MSHILCHAVQVRNVALTCTADLLKAPQAHHEALATPGFASHLLQALRVSVGRLQPQSCVASSCAASSWRQAWLRRERHSRPANTSGFQAEGAWREGLDDGQAAQAQAARCAAELAGNPETHPALIKQGLAEQVATQAARLVSLCATPRTSLH